MTLPPQLFSKEQYSDEDEPQADYLSFRDELGKSIFLNLSQLKGTFHQTLLDTLSE